MSRSDRGQRDPLAGLEGDIVQAFRATPGFYAFVAALCLPLLAAVVIYAGAAAVSSEVYAARTEAAEREGSSFNVQPPDGGDVAGWKKALVGVCPVH